MAVYGTQQRVEHHRDASHENARIAAAELPVGGVDDAHLAHPCHSSQQSTGWAWERGGASA